MGKPPGISTLSIDEPLIFEKGSPGRIGVSLPDSMENDAVRKTIPKKFIRDDIDDFPELSQVEIVRHYTRLSQYNYSVDMGFYPLGSCTMKYNPKINEETAKLRGFSFIHPLQPEQLSQGAMRLMYELECFLAEITGMDSVTLQPAAGAHGELTGMLVVKAYFDDIGQKRTKVLIPDTAHGTNPASVSMCGFDAVPIKSNEDGIIDKKSLKAAVDDDVAAIMITNPNTLGLFETDIKDISAIVHENGGLVYGDGANLNALMGVVSAGETGLDLVHINLHKTFSTPHGGGGPGSGPLAVKKALSQYLPVPFIKKKEQNYFFDYDVSKSIGKIRSFYGNFLICVRAYAYILSMGGSGLNRASRTAVTNANYIRSKLEKYYHLPYSTSCLHECVLTDKKQQEHNITTLDIAKRLIDYGFHPPTIYFPLVVNGALMIEPTETESKQTIDLFIDAMISIAREAEQSPQKLKNAPVKSKVGRVDEVLAARSPVLRWTRKRV
jgi:glycine dehydrogenase subunit 2